MWTVTDDADKRWFRPSKRSAEGPCCDGPKCSEFAAETIRHDRPPGRTVRNGQTCLDSSNELVTCSPWRGPTGPEASNSACVAYQPQPYAHELPFGIVHHPLRLTTESKTSPVQLFWVPLPSPPSSLASLALVIRTMIDPQAPSNSIPWMSLAREGGPSVRVHHGALDQLPSREAPTSPTSCYSSSPAETLDAPLRSTIVLAGGDEKHRFIQSLGITSPYRHGQVRVSVCPALNRAMVVDCDWLKERPCHWGSPPPLSGPHAFRPLEGVEAGSVEASKIGAVLCARTLLPVATTICLFAAKTAGMHEIVETVVDQIQFHGETDVSALFRPRLLIVLGAPTTAACDPDIYREQLMRKMRGVWRGRAQSTDLETRLCQVFDGLQIHLADERIGLDARRAALRRTLIRVDDEAREARRLSGLLFRPVHLDAFVRGLVDGLAREPRTPFSFVRFSRPRRARPADLEAHLRSLLAFVPTEAWLWHFVVPLLASALLFTTYPPGAHRK